MTPGLRTPSERICERCGRIEVWDDDAGRWQLAVNDEGEPHTVGSPYCIHEWDINGTFVPFDDKSDAAEA
ncbi:HEWD family protein [Halobellus ordinarius]|uniref:HEWD family protein n=1 Tax=Halobellus ordinarius TaxID=3075120 RepID=UPI00287FF4D4|nr:HEWD family protein [Halobellus sp. ZY16]